MDDPIRIYGNPDYGQSGPSTPPPFPPPQPSPPRRALSGPVLTVLIIAPLAFALVVGVLAGRALDSHRTATNAPATPPAASAQAAPASSPPPADRTVGRVGEWAAAQDGVKFRVSKLARSTVADTSAGGHPGDPAVIVTFEVMNGSQQRLDLSALQVTARLGPEGREAEMVFQDGFDGTPSGSLAPGHTSTSQYLFDAKGSVELRTIAIEASPGPDYNNFTFEGGLT